MKPVILKLIKLYQKTLSIILGRLKINYGCRFYPTCSNYCYQAIEKHGTIKGLFKGIIRVLRCNPLNKGGTDLC